MHVRVCNDKLSIPPMKLVQISAMKEKAELVVIASPSVCVKMRELKGRDNLHRLTKLYTYLRYMIAS